MIALQLMNGLRRNEDAMKKLAGITIFFPAKASTY